MQYVAIMTLQNNCDPETQRAYIKVQPGHNNTGQEKTTENDRPDDDNMQELWHRSWVHRHETEN